MENKPEKKSYLEIAKSPVITPINSPNNIHKKVIRTGIIDMRLKWYINTYNPDEICFDCKKGIEAVEWNSYYKLSVVRYIDYKDEYKLKVENEKDENDEKIYCDNCKNNVINKFKEEKKKLDIKSLTESGILSTPMIRSMPTPLLSTLLGENITEIPSLTLE